MSFRSFIIFTLLSTLSACSHLSPKSDGEPVASTSPVEQTEILKQANGSEAPEQSATLDENDLTIAVAPEIDLLSRIRDGFVLSDFKSKHIAQYEKWSSQHPSYLNDLFSRAEPFLFYIVEEIEKRGLPMELALLPAVESAYKPNAVSRSAAGGLWQFIPSTGKYYGLRQDWWYDGRRDAISATTAALDYLSSLNKMFEGDWLLTLAAYNAGPGTVRKAIKFNKRKRRPTNYKSLRLRSETERYVPKLFALRNIILNPEKYGVTLPAIENKPHFDIVELPGQIDLHHFSELSSVELASLQHLNAGFRRWATSPDGPHRLLVPLSVDVTKIEHALAHLESAPRVSFRNHKISQGDTLSAIARRYGVSVSSLKTVNKMRGTSIRAGRNLLIPVSNKQQYQLAQSKRGNASNLTSRAPNSMSRNANQLVHRVVAGDTLWSIARRYQVKVAELLSWNKLGRNQILSLNQALLIFVNRG